jgi:hypothetical protein
MKNKFAATCSRCRQKVPVGCGETTRAGGAWITEHAGGCPPAPEAMFPGELRAGDILSDFSCDSGEYYHDWSEADYQSAFNPDEGNH